MRIGIPKEIKAQEYRVGLTPDAVADLVAAGHSLFVETGAGCGSGYSDDDYLAAGAQLSVSMASLYRDAQLIVKVKEPQASEVVLLQADHRLFCYLHLAPTPDLTTSLMASGALCVAYETITDEQGRLPLLKPMSEIAGRLSVQAGAHCLEKAQGGSGVLLGGVSGLEPGHVLIFGGGVVGSNAADVALGMGAKVTLVEPFAARRTSLEAQFKHPRFSVCDSANLDLRSLLNDVDMVVGAALVPGAAAPKLLSRTDLSALAAGSVLVDVSVDQGGCFETTKPTTHLEPTFLLDGIVHYCVANIPSAVARTASQALSQSTLRFVHLLAEQNIKQAFLDNAGLAAGLSIAKGKLTCAAVAGAQGRDAIDWQKII
ncbi:alanine dehydrogenase [uncultured Zhongshania sp.]|uniref:alanine dehydrogenase n=1 Tax=uncultured Zhongshania sp. TaxID=1642288 RepID=UPI0030D7AC23|tara:strand:- start:3549 stop:4664 length:1116 start_codon:yes stop_codon:yes gene_type:complete